jgi:peptidoglycan/xylan/chitin deacetylase (PgdA/CDA1 family)
MTLFLTYHKVNPGENSGDSGFYTVTQRQLEAHFESLAAMNLTCVSGSALSEEKLIPPNNFVLSFDDATADHFEIVWPLLRKRGWTAIFFVPTAKLNKPGYLTEAQLQEIAQAGNHIGGHSHEHRRLDLFSDSDMREQMDRSHRIISELTGNRPRLFAPPGGFINEHVREVALGYGVEAIRTMHWGYNERYDCTALETIPINRHSDSKKFQKILEFRQTRYLYFGKQAMKALVPSGAYEKIRSSLFKISGRN